MVHITVKGWQIFPKYSHLVGTPLISRVSCKKGPTHHAYAWNIGPFWQDTLDMHWPVCVIRMVSSALAPNRCHGINNSPADSIMASYELPYAIRIMLQQLTLNVWGGPSYLGLIRSISYDIDYVEYVSPGLTWGRILSTHVISMWSNDIKCKYMFMFPLKNLARKGLIKLCTMEVREVIKPVRL